jgi:hypothetical protein
MVYKFRPPQGLGDAKECLAELGFADSGLRIRRVCRSGADAVCVRCEGEERTFAECVYAFVFGNHIARFGTAEKLRGRVESYRDYVPGHWAAKDGTSSYEEGIGWRWLFDKHEEASVYAKEPRLWLPNLAVISTALSEERYCIKAFKPCLNRSGR